MNGGRVWTRVLTVAVAVAVSVAFADSSIVVLALPELYAEFQTSIPGISLVITAYNVVVAIGAFLLLPVVRRVGPVQIVRVGLLAFLGACVGCAASQDLTTLIVFRCLQGAGAVLLLVGALPLLGGLTKSQTRGAAVWVLAGTVGAALGPALGGALTQAFDWRAIFIVQAPIAGLALAATVGAHLRDVPVDTGTRAKPPAPAANAALAFLFGALVGALFLAVLMLVAVWGLSPIAGAGVVSAIPVATVAMRAIEGGISPVLAVVAGCILLAAGLAALALLPETSEVYAACALAICGAGLGLAVPGLTHATISPEHGLLRSAAWSIGMRHAGLVAALVIVAPLLARDLQQAQDDATLAGAAIIIDAPLPLSAKAPLALGLRDEFEATPRGEVPDLESVFTDAGESSEAVAAVKEDLVGTIEDVITRAFRNSFAVTALFALVALIPGVLAVRRAR